MQKMLRSLFLLFLLPNFLFAQQKPDALKVTQFKLDNGLTVLLNEDHTLPDVMGAVAVKAGSKYDPKDATGMGHYLEHMLFKGTDDFGTTDFAKEKPILDEISRLYDELGKTKDEKQRAAIQKQINEKSVEAAKYAVPNEMDRLLKSIGSQGVNAFTSFEMIVYHNSFPGHQMEKWLDLYSHRFQNPVFRLFQSELEVVYEEKNRGADDFGNNLFETYLAHFFKNHPYGTQTTIGTTEHLKNPSLNKMYQYYNTYYVPNNMALVLSGNFNTEEVIPMIKAKFGTWKAKEVPKFPEYKEEPFNGREEFTKRLSPIKIGVMGFRTVPENNPDKEALEVCNYLLSNEGETGLLDQLRINKKLQMAESFNESLLDQGMAAIIFVPKIIGQSLSNAEGNVLEALAKLKQGDFDAQMLDAARNNLQKSFYRNLENPKQRAFYMVNAFIADEDWNSFLKYPERIQKVTIEDVKRVANQYYGPNYLVMFSKMGFPKKDKLKKPGFQPVAGKEGVKSAYAEKFEKLPSSKPSQVFIDFKKDIQQSNIAGRPLFVTQNPVNDIFTLKIKYKTNSANQPLLPLAAAYFGSIGTTAISAKDFKSKMNILGCTYGFSAEGDALVITLDGMEQNFKEALSLINQLLQNPALDKDKLGIVVSDEKTERKLETGDPTALNQVMQEYLFYGKNSSYVTRPSGKQLAKITPEQLVEVMREALQYEASVHFVGKAKADEVQSIFSANYIWPATQKPAAAPYYTLRQTYPEPTVLFLNRKDARQSHLNFYANGKPLQMEQFPFANAFNSYFGGDMSSIVFQEIREFRSLAYASSFYVGRPSHKGENYFLSGYIGCQSDKTNEALTAMEDLLHNMPEKPNRLLAIKSGLTDVAYASRPDFRNLSQRIQVWEEMGYSQDPNKIFIPYYEKLGFADITSFYKQNVQNLPVSIAIVGNKKDVDVKALEKYGKVKMISVDDIRTK